VISEIQSRPKPLVVYAFSENSKNIKLIKEKTRSGSFVVNDAVVHLLNCHLPFGGVGASGYGRYHGKSGFLAFSNPKSVC
jgi:aldehyde dehydrogenase (NAD+)